MCQLFSQTFKRLRPHDRQWSGLDWPALSISDSTTGVTQPLPVASEELLFAFHPARRSITSSAIAWSSIASPPIAPSIRAAV